MKTATIEINVNETSAKIAKYEVEMKGLCELFERRLQKDAFTEVLRISRRMNRVEGFLDSLRTLRIRGMNGGLLTFNTLY